MKSNVTVLCHRGWWDKPEEQNTLAAFARAFDAGLGVELDVRDFDGELVVSHDPPLITLDKFGRVEPPDRYFEEVLDHLGDRDLPLAVNVKSCGLAPLFAAITPKPKNWFFFDVAPGDEVPYMRNGLPLFARDRWDADPVLLISWELFDPGNDPSHLWEVVKNNHDGKPILLVTDRPREAMDYFQ